MKGPAMAAACLLTLALAGCALPRNEPAFKTPTTTGPDDQVRDRARIHTELASGYYEMGNMGIALEEVREALRADPNYGPAYNVAGLVYAELKEDKYAHEHFQRALRIDPLDSDANNNYGRFLCDRKREDEAIRYFLAALRNPLYQNPDRSYVNAGLCLRRRGDAAGAEDYFNKALKIRGGQPQALYQLADMAYARHAYPVAKDYLIRLEKISPANPELLWLALRVERKLGDRDAVASYGTQLTRNFPQSKEARALLAGIDE
jgi:type IV pilus assembly protein PilF